MAKAVAVAKRANKARGLRKPVEQLQRACEVLDGAPTPLLEASHNDCLSTADFLEALVAFPKKARACRTPGAQASAAPAQEGSSCLSGPVEAIVAKIRTAIKNAMAANQALDKRKIHGRCRKAIGTSKRDLGTMSRIAATAEAFARAIEAGDSSRVKEAAKRFQAALERIGSGPNEDPVKLVRSCRPG